MTHSRDLSEKSAIDDKGQLNCALSAIPKPLERGRDPYEEFRGILGKNTKETRDSTYPAAPVTTAFFPCKRPMPMLLMVWGVEVPDILNKFYITEKMIVV